MSRQGENPRLGREWTGPVREQIPHTEIDALGLRESTGVNRRLRSKGTGKMQEWERRSSSNKRKGGRQGHWHTVPTGLNRRSLSAPRQSRVHLSRSAVPSLQPS